MSCPFRKNVSKKKREEIMHNTNNRHLNNSDQFIQSYPAHSYSHVLAHRNSPGHSTSGTSVNSPPGYTSPTPNSITFPIHLFQHSKKAAFQMQLSAYLSPHLKTKRFRVPLKQFWTLFLLLTAPHSKWLILKLLPHPSHLPQLTLHL